MRHCLAHRLDSARRFFMYGGSEEKAKSSIGVWYLQRTQRPQRVCEADKAWGIAPILSLARLERWQGSKRSGNTWHSNLFPSTRASVWPV
jgi:hypothetical protein